MKRIPHPRFALFLGLILLSLPFANSFMRLEEAVVFAFNIASFAFIAATLPLWLDDHPDEMRRRGARDEGGRPLLLLISAAVLGAVVAALSRMVQTKEALTMPDLLQVVATLTLAFIFVNLVYAHHYGHLFYDQRDQADAGGLVFPGGQEPVFADFCYFAFVVGMTSAVSDVNIESRAMRRAVTLHGLLAFIFNLGVLALVINVLSGVL